MRAKIQVKHSLQVKYQKTITQTIQIYSKRNKVKGQANNTAGITQTRRVSK